MIKSLRWILLFSGLLLLLLLFSNKHIPAILFGATPHRMKKLDPGNIQVLHERTIAWQKQSAFADSIFMSWAGKPVSEKSLTGKGNAPRIILAKMLSGHEVEGANSLLKKHVPWGVSGSSWVLNRKGDYDFTITIFSTILWLFGDRPEILYPETRDYLLNTLLTEDGNKFRYTAPRTLGLVMETENHLLMTEGSRFLKNRWIMLHGNNDEYFDNEKNGMEHRLLAMLDELKTTGLYEFNSNPYVGYTITALLNLEAFASEKVQKEARDVLDYMNWCYALGSYQLKHYPPMRRRYEKAALTGLVTDYHSIFMKSWLSYSTVAEYNTNISNGEAHALMGACMPYRPAAKVVGLIFNKGNGYFVRLGHGPRSSPEIYAAGKDFLISAGGTNRGKRSLIVARPICLFLNDSTTDLSSVIHLSGPGSDFMDWNNTGVYKNFACAAGPVKVPKTFTPAVRDEEWSLFAAGDSLLIAVHSEAELGLLAVFQDTNAGALLSRLKLANPDSGQLKSSFQFPDGQKLTYDLNAPRSKWIIVSENGQLLNRDFDNWPLIEGEFK